MKLTLKAAIARYGADPVAAASYVRFYREMWDSEEKEDASRPPRGRI